jgi:hypothetical protein
MNIPETLKMSSLSGLGKRPQGILRNQSIRGLFGFQSNFQNCFWNVFSTSVLSQICKKKKCLEASKSLLNEYSEDTKKIFQSMGSEHVLRGTGSFQAFFILHI